MGFQMKSENVLNLSFPLVTGDHETFNQSWIWARKVQLAEWFEVLQKVYSSQIYSKPEHDLLGCIFGKEFSSQTTASYAQISLNIAPIIES